MFRLAQYSDIKSRERNEKSEQEGHKFNLFPALSRPTFAVIYSLRLFNVKG